MTMNLGLRSLLNLLKHALMRVTASLQGIPGGMVSANRGKRLRLCETLPLGEKRFLAVVQFEQQQFLVGGSGDSIALLTQLPFTEQNSEQPAGVVRRIS